MKIFRQLPLLSGAAVALLCLGLMSPVMAQDPPGEVIDDGTMTVGTMAWPGVGDELVMVFNLEPDLHTADIDIGADPLRHDAEVTIGSGHDLLARLRHDQGDHGWTTGVGTSSAFSFVLTHGLTGGDHAWPMGIERSPIAWHPDFLKLDGGATAFLTEQRRLDSPPGMTLVIDTLPDIDRGDLGTGIPIAWTAIDHYGSGASDRIDGSDITFIIAGGGVVVIGDKAFPQTG